MRSKALTPDANSHRLSANFGSNLIIAFARQAAKYDLSTFYKSNFFGPASAYALKILQDLRLARKWNGNPGHMYLRLR
jgi:hypothetical protein